jgi:dihydrofolate reductase
VTSNPDKYMGIAHETITGNVKDRITEIANNVADSSGKDVWIIGGKNLIEQCWDIIDEFHLTIINGHYDCDIKLDFPMFDFTLIQGDVKDSNIYYIYRRAK